MTTEPPNQIPSEITAGDFTGWRLSLLDYPASDGWTIFYALVKDGKLIGLLGVPDGDDHVFFISSAESATYPPGLYRFQQYAKQGENRTTIENGQVVVLPDFFAQTEGYDSRTPAEKPLDTLKATYDKLAAKSLASKSGGIASVTDKALSELRVEIEKQEGVVLREHRAKLRKEGKRTGTKIKVRFN